MIQFYTYIYVDPKTNVIRYVGKGRGNRSHVHLRKSTNSRLHNMIKKRVSEGYEIKPFLYYHKNDNDSIEKEKFWIKLFGREDLGTGTLFNHTDGGDVGVPGNNWNKGKTRPEDVKEKISLTVSQLERGPRSDVTKQRISEANMGRVHSEETKAKMSLSAKGKIKSAEHRANLALANTGKKLPAETKAKMAAAKLGKKRGPMTLEHKAKLSAARQRYLTNKDLSCK